VMGAASGTATLFSPTPWSSGQLDAYLGISASPANPIGAYGAGGSSYDVYQVNLGTETLSGTGSPFTGAFRGNFRPSAARHLHSRLPEHGNDLRS
jgi:hypothetical protein